MNNYDNAEPKPLKFLVSDGKLVDESGNVIAESDSLQELYIKSSPQVKKYLLSDGSVVDEEGNLIIKNDYYKKVYDQATPKVAKYLHSDGTIDENPGGGSGADLEDNHQTTIDVSTYTEPVEIEPTAGKDGMKKATVTLSNIPGGNKKLYYYSGANHDYLPIGNGIYSFYSTEEITEAGSYILVYGYTGGGDEIPDIESGAESFVVRQEGVYLMQEEQEYPVTIVRDSSKDVTL